MRLPFATRDGADRPTPSLGGVRDGFVPPSTSSSACPFDSRLAPPGRTAAPERGKFPHRPDSPHILNTPKRVSPTGAFADAESDSASTSRDLRGSTIPSSQSLAEA